MRRVLVVVLLLAVGCRPKKVVPKDAEATSDLFHDCPSPKTIRVQRASFPGTSKGALELARAVVAADKAERERLVQSLRPDSADYAGVFDVEFAKRMEAYAAPLWDAGLPDQPLAPGPDDDDAFVFSLTPDLLHKPGSELCGRAYASTDVEKHFGPNVTVHCWAPMHNAVEHYGAPLVEALVFVRGHWALFPRPHAVPALVHECPPHVETDPVALAITPRPTVTIPVGSPADAQRVLDRFLEPASDRKTLLLALEPSLADYRAIYREPLASKLHASLAPKWRAFATGGPAPADGVLPDGKDDIVWVSHANARDLRGGNHSCPVGLADLASSLRSQDPIYCFSFTRLGLGGSWMDGLSFVHGRWVLIPRAFEND